MIAVVGESKVRDPVARRVRELATGGRRRVDSCHAVIGWGGFEKRSLGLCCVSDLEREKKGGGGKEV